MENNYYTYLQIGIVPANIDLNEMNNYRKGYATNLSNLGKYNLGVYTPLYNIKGKKGDIIEIIVDLSKEKGELSYSLNDKKLGIFCEDINKNEDFVPFVEMNYENSEITLLE